MTRAFYAPVAPIHLLLELKEYGLLGNYNLVLAHDVLANSQMYKDLFYEGRGSRRTLFLDNSVIETGEAFPPDKIFEAAEHLGKPVICLPDVLGDMVKTIAKVQDFIFWARDAYDYMVIPQGENEVEVLQCAKYILEGVSFTPAYWGVPRWMANKFGTRRWIIEHLHAMYEAPIHLLGCSDNLHDDIQCARMPEVCGIDSANPLNLGQQGKVLYRDPYVHLPRRFPVEVSGGEIVYDYWKQKILTPEAVMNVVKLRSVLI